MNHSLCAQQLDAKPEIEQRLSLDLAWRFHQGDIPVPVIKGHMNSYYNAKAGKAWAAAAPEYDDQDWRVVNLPHDWVVEGPFDPNENSNQGYRPRGMAWYRRSLRLDIEDRGRSLELQFDGIATHCKVWINGTVVHRNWCGYTGFHVDITPFVTYGDLLNSIVIQVDANAQEGWWYEGGGIYRHTWLIKRNAIHLATDGVWANPVRREDGRWELPIEATIQNDSKAPASAQVNVELINPEGEWIAGASALAETNPLENTVVVLTLPVSNPSLWSVETPTLYTVRTTLMRDGVQIDQRVTRCGFRTIRFDANQGFFLNDQPVKLKGTCNHQDHAGVGVAVPDSLWDFRIRKLKEMGSNAYRCAHNPPAAEFLDACDRLGLLVMNENRHFNVSPEYMRQLEWLVRRDRNHPSIILWSAFNEENCQGTEMGYEMVRRMRALVKRLDPTRPVTAAMNGGLTSPVNVSQTIDVLGFNYQQVMYDSFHKANPELPLISSEDTCCFMTRGVYEMDDALAVADSYDMSPAPWGATHRNAWKAIAERPFMAGGFVWTGFDYRGEPYKFTWPAVSSMLGIMDTCGFPKTAFYIRQAAWVEDRPVLQLIPHWNWKGKEGQLIKVMAITNANSVELFLNGKSLGEKPVDKLEGGEWQVPYEQGRLEAIARMDGKEFARTHIETTGEPAALKLTPDRSALAGNGADTQPITVSAVDAEGREVPTANLPVTFEISGPGLILGHGNGDNTSHEPEKGNRRSLFNGLAQVILQSLRDSSGMIRLTASAEGLTTAEVLIEVHEVEPLPAVPPPERVFALTEWRMSPITMVKPDPNQELEESDMNSWTIIRAGTPQIFEEGGFALYRVIFTPVGDVQNRGGHIMFKLINGAAEIWIDGKLEATKPDAVAGECKVELLPSTQARTLTVLIDSCGIPDAGFAGAVIISPNN